MQDSSNFGKSILNTVDALKNRCKELEKELTFTKSLLDDMSAVAQKNEDLKNTAEYRLGKEIEKNKELENVLLKSAETTARFCNSTKDYAQTVTHLANENAALSQKLIACEDRTKTITKDAQKATLRNIWMNTALQCLADQIKSEDTTNRCMATIMVADTFERIEPELSQYLANQVASKTSNDELHAFIVKRFAKEWEIIENSMS